MLRTLLASGTLFLTIALAVALGIAAGYGMITAILRLPAWRRPAPVQPARERAAAPALSVGAD